MNEVERNDLIEEYYSENRKLLVKDITAYILNKNKKYKDYESEVYAKSRNLSFSLIDVVENGIDKCDEALSYCLSSAEFSIDDIVYTKQKRDRNRAIKALKLIFKDLKIVDNGNKYIGFK